MPETTAAVGGTWSQRRGILQSLWAALLWLLFAATLEIAWVSAELDASHRRLIPIPYNVALVVLVAIGPALAKHPYLVWFAAAMPLWILLLVVAGAQHS